MAPIRVNHVCLLTAVFTCLILSLLFLTSSSPYYSKSQYFTVTSNQTDYVNIEKYPGAFVQYAHPDPANSSYCEFNYGFPKDLKFETSDVNFGPELEGKSSYRILYNVINAKMGPNVPGITYATHVTADFVSYIPELVRYWDGYISIAAFVPDTDVALVLERLNQYCYCLPEMSRVSVHLVFPKEIPPSRRDVHFTKSSNCKVEDSQNLETYRNFDEKIMYPINVCRNAARRASLTEHIIVSDIQLMPSEGLAGRFLTMVDAYKLWNFTDKVFVLPIFEIEAGEDLPRSKNQLLQLLREGKAVYFHRLICSHCQKFPGIEAWMTSDPGDVVKPLVTAKREVPYNRWEPIYIGTRNEPLYNEVLSWEGLQDKMLQMLEMCLIGYKFVILDGAFLVHWPGMKKTKTKDGETWRDDFVKQNSLEYKKILKKLTSKYKPNPHCKLQ